jgi:ribose transport system permease protein
MTTDNSPPSPDVSPAPSPKQGGESSKGAAALRLFRLLGPFVGLIVVVAIFSVPADVRRIFLSVGNFQLVVNQTVVVALAALGMTMIIISGGIDLSVGSVIALTSVSVAVMLRNGMHPWPALVVGILLGGLVGLINGALITGLRVTPFIVTLGTLGIARGVAQWLAQDTTVYPPHTWIDRLTEQTALGGVSKAVWLAVALALAVQLLLRGTVFGRSVFAIGSNETASRLSGLRVDALKIGTYALAGLFFGLAGVIQYAQLSGLGDPGVAAGKELDVIAAVVIGGGSLSGGEGSVLGSLVGALMMAILRNGSQIMGWPDYTQLIIIGAVVVIAVALDRLRHLRASRT